MKFESKKDLLFTLIFGGVVLFLLYLLIFKIFIVGNFTPMDYFIAAVLIIVIAYLIWSYSDTWYLIKGDKLIYRSGPIRGGIDILSISKLTLGKTLWVGLVKPATSRKGIIIHYNAYDELYISPQSNEALAKALKTINNKIIIETWGSNSNS